MKIALTMTLVGLALAILMTVIVESRIRRQLSKRADALCAWTAIFGCYGVCVGVISLFVEYCFNASEWLALIIALPLGCPLLYLAGKAGEA